MNNLENINEIKTPANIMPEDIKKYICPLATEKEIFMFLQMCKMTNLNPFLREAYLVKYRQDQPATMLTGYESYLKRAERSELYGGLRSWTEGSVATGDLKGIVEVFRKDWPKPLVHEAFYDEYVQMTTDYQTKQKRPNHFWAEKPRTMIKKVAISQAFRLAFPTEFSGMPYTFDEKNDIDDINTQKTPETPILSTKPDLPMPTPSNPMEMPEMAISDDSRGIVKGDGKSNKVIEEDDVPDSIPIIAKGEWQRIVTLAQKNGWTAVDIANEVKALGYKANKEHTPLNALDAEDIESFFSINKKDYEAKMKKNETKIKG